MPPWKKRYVNGCHIINSDQTILGTSPNRGKKRPSAFDRVCKTKIPKLKQDWLTNGETTLFLDKMKKECLNMWYADVKKYEGISYKKITD